MQIVGIPVDESGVANLFKIVPFSALKFSTATNIVGACGFGPGRGTKSVLYMFSLNISCDCCLEITSAVIGRLIALSAAMAGNIVRSMYLARGHFLTQWNVPSKLALRCRRAGLPHRRAVTNIVY